MKKSLTLLLTVFIAMLMAGLYGIVHDQFTYTISPEYYTKLKFIQFGLMESKEAPVPSNPRLLVAIVGFLATWWVGFWIGLFIGIISLFYPTPELMLRKSLRLFLLVVLIALLTGLAGFGISRAGLMRPSPEYYGSFSYTKDIVDVYNFLDVGEMHKFSYLGGLIGLIIAVVKNLRSILQFRKSNSQSSSLT